MLSLTFKESEMQGPGVPSLDQLQVFLTVVETGSFAAAGRKLGRANSAVSYAIANLEQQLGVQLFDRDRTRKPMLTANRRFRPIGGRARYRSVSTACGPKSGACWAVSNPRSLSLSTSCCRLLAWSTQCRRSRRSFQPSH